MRGNGPRCRWFAKIQPYRRARIGAKATPSRHVNRVAQSRFLPARAFGPYHDEVHLMNAKRAKNTAQLQLDPRVR